MAKNDLMGLLRLLAILLLLYLLWRWFHSIRPGPAARDRPKPPPAARRPHEVLGVSPQASQEEIRRAYQTLVKQYHPDRIEDMAPELRTLAEERTKEITAAYHALKRS